ncbi:MAG: DUF4249 family protein [Muribaculaceae bacterium]
MPARLIIILFAAIAISSCVDEYEVGEEQLLNSDGTALYIDGRILVGAMSYVYIEQPLALNSANSAKYVEDAVVSIKGDNGYDSGPIYYNKESYRYDIDTYNINPNEKYKVIVNHNGNTYESNYLKSEPAPKIKNLYFREERVRKNLIFYVDAEGDENTHNFMWTFDEDYEVHASVNMLYTMHDNGYIINYAPSAFPELDKKNKINPYLYCWTHRNSTNINIYSTSNLTENVVKMHEVFRLSANLSRFDHLYCMTLYQSAITDEAYNYYATMKRLTELTGSLFSPMPSDVKGNIKCTKGGQKDPRGYITASQVTYKRLFINNKDITLKRDYKLDYIPGGQFTLDKDKLLEGYVLWSKKLENSTPMDERLYYPEACNCQKVSTKIKPEWWPNDLE